MNANAPALGSCTPMGLAIVCHGPRNIHRRRVFKCWTCERRTPHIIKWDGAWYGTTQYCVVCLDGWQDGYRMERPFRRGWKVERAARIKSLWDSALLPVEYHRWVYLDVHRATCHDETGNCAECNGGAA